MEPIHNKRIYTPAQKSTRKTPVVAPSPKTSEVSPKDPADQKPEQPPVHERRSGRERRKKSDKAFVDMRSGDDRRKKNHVDIKI